MDKVIPKYDIDKIKFSVDEKTYARALELHQSGKVTSFREDLGRYYYAIIQGTESFPYMVSVSAKSFNVGNCDCYLGQREIHLQTYGRRCNYGSNYD